MKFKALSLWRGIAENFLAMVDRLEPPGVIFAVIGARPRAFLIAGLILLYATQVWDFRLSLAGQRLRVYFNNPESWDYLLLSGVTLLIVGLWMSLRLRPGIGQTIRRVVDSGALETSENIESLLGDIDVRGGEWAHRIAALLALILSGSITLGLSLASDSDISFIVEWGFIGIVGGYVGGLVLGRMVAYGFLGWFLIDRGAEFRVQPGHIDRACGFKPLGDFYFFQAMIVALPALHIFLWTSLMPVWPYYYYGDDWIEVYISLIPVSFLLVVLSFVVPMLSFHAIMKREKTFFIKIADELGREILELQHQLEQPMSAEDRQSISDQLRVMTQRYYAIAKMPTWPAAFNTMRRFAGNSFALAIPLVIPLVEATEISVWLTWLMDLL